MKRRLARLVGIAVALVAGGYFILHVSRSLGGSDLRRLLEPAVLGAGMLLTVGYAALVPITGVAWSWLLRSMGEPSSARITVPVLAATQFGKYLPGNVAQHFGRVVVMRAKGHSTGAVVVSVVYETVLVVMACAHASALSLLWSPPGMLRQWPVLEYRLPLLALITLGAIACIHMLPPAVRWITRRRGVEMTAAAKRPAWRVVLASYLAYVANYVLIGVALWLAGSLIATGHATVPGPAYFVGAFAASWILGFLAPGAPAGLGVREAVLSIWLEPVMGAETGLLLIILLRVATTVGDLGNLALGSLLLARARRYDRQTSAPGAP